MIKPRKGKYTKPASNEKAVVFPYNNNKQFDFETRKHQNVGKLSPWKRIVGNKMLNEDTGEIIEIKPKEKRVSRAVFRALKKVYRSIKNNFNGNDTEIIIVLEFESIISDTKVLKRLIKNFIEKLIRRLGEIIFVRVLLYKETNQPIIHIWVKTADKSKLEVSQETLEELWDSGNISTRKITKANIDYKAKYFLGEETDMALYPTGIKVFSTSNNIKKVQPIELDYEEAEKLVKGYKQTYSGAVTFVNEEEDKPEEEIQHITYEQFFKTEGIRLKRNPNTAKYKGTAVRDFKKKQKIKADKNFAEITRLTEKHCWFKVERLDTDLCRIIVKSTGKVFNTLDTRQTLLLVRHLLNKNKKGGN